METRANLDRQLERIMELLADSLLEIPDEEILDTSTDAGKGLKEEAEQTRAILRSATDTQPERITGLHQTLRAVNVNERVKRVMDILGSSLALIVLSPAFLLIALAIKVTSKGPVLFRQRRVGKDGQTFTFLKFRSMYVNNDARHHERYVKELIEGNATLKARADGRDGVFKLIDDPRITTVGKVLRQTSLDELPQFFNVLIGDMSLVGPRPPIPYELEAYDLWHRRRLEVKPGITGLWQVSYRNCTFDEMVLLDLQYARNWTPWLDIWILLITPVAVIRKIGAN